MESSAEAPPAPGLRGRDDIPGRFKWNLEKIFRNWEEWRASYDELDRKIAAFAAMAGTLAEGGDRLLAALALRDEIGQLSYKVWYFASLWYDQDQREPTPVGPTPVGPTPVIGLLLAGVR